MTELLKQGIAVRDMRLKAAQGTLSVPAVENLSILLRLLQDEDVEIRTVAAATLDRVPETMVAAVLSTSGVPDEVRDYLIGRRGETPVAPVIPAAVESAGRSGADRSTEPLVSLETGSNAIDPSDDVVLTTEEGIDRESIHQKLTQMTIPERVKAAMKGSREVRAQLIRDPNRMIASAVLMSPKLTEAEVEGFARMGNVSEDVLRVIGSNRTWMKKYGVMAALVKNAKTPLGISLTLMGRLNTRDLVKLSFDRNVAEPLRIAAKTRAGASRG